MLANSTSLGMAPKVDETPVPRAAIGNFGLVFDAVYTPVWTRLLLDAREAGCQVSLSSSWSTACTCLPWTCLPWPNPFSQSVPPPSPPPPPPGGRRPADVCLGSVPHPFTPASPSTSSPTLHSPSRVSTPCRCLLGRQQTSFGSSHLPLSPHLPPPLQVVDGLQMFVGQAADQFRLFTGGAEPPVELMQKTLADAISASTGTKK